MSRTRIVAVDDDRRILRILKHACERVGFEVHCVQDAKFFEPAFLAYEPELVFLDLNMRNIDGVELLRFIAEESPGTSSRYRGFLYGSTCGFQLWYVWTP